MDGGKGTVTERVKASGHSHFPNQWGARTWPIFPHIFPVIRALNSGEFKRQRYEGLQRKKKESMPMSRISRYEYIYIYIHMYICIYDSLSMYSGFHPCFMVLSLHLTRTISRPYLLPCPRGCAWEPWNLGPALNDQPQLQRLKP